MNNIQNAIVICKIFFVKIITRSNSFPDDWSNNFFKKFIFKNILSLADKNIVNSIEVKNKFKSKYKINPVCIYNPLNKKQIIKLSKHKIKTRTQRYREIISAGDKECPEKKCEPGQKRRPAQTKSRNLLERLRGYETETLRFMIESLAPFTNNLGERDIRMTKVQQKISGCFVSMKTAKEHYIIKSYISTCKKHDISASDALIMLYENRLPALACSAPGNAGAGR